jgi:deazaflavin-dependent oxidoreductase (nitroreductase family)
MIGGILKQLGATRPGVWVIRHVVAPLDRRLYRWTNGRFLSAGRPLAPTLLLTTTGRKSGQPHTTPLFYLRDGPRLILCNVNPGFERPNPWTLNIRARPVVTVQIGRWNGRYHAREATDEEIALYWPQLVQLWPAYQQHFARSGQRSLFVLEEN